MQIKAYHSSSAGNLYQIDNLLIDAGVPIAKITKALNFRLSEIEGCLISHEHRDHSLAARHLMRAGVDVYMSNKTSISMALNLSGHRLHVIEPMKQFRIGEWNIKPFSLPHDVPNMGFLISNGESKILYAVDTHYIPYRFDGLNYILISCNYDAETLKRNIRLGLVDVEVGKRILMNHMSLATVKDFLIVNDLSRVREIWLLHLSATNSNGERFKREIMRVSGKPVYVAGS